MDEDLVLREIVKSLAFEIEAVNQDNVLKWSTTNGTPLNVKVRVRNKDEPRLVQTGTMPVPRIGISAPEKLALVSSNQTILSFSVFLQDEYEKKEKLKRHSGFKLFNIGSCLGTYSDDDGPYLPSSSNQSAIVMVGSNSSITSPSGILNEKESQVLSTSNAITRNKKRFFGKCKPGGCLDPPFGEDNYSYDLSKTNRKENIQVAQNKLYNVDKEKCKPGGCLDSHYSGEKYPYSISKPENEEELGMKQDEIKDDSIKSRKKKSTISRETETFVQKITKDGVDPKIISNVYGRASEDHSLTFKYSTSIITYPTDTHATERVYTYDQNNANRNKDDDTLRQNYESPESYFVPAKDVIRYKDEERRSVKRLSIDQLSRSSKVSANGVADKSNLLKSVSKESKYIPQIKKESEDTFKGTVHLTKLQQDDTNSASKASENKHEIAVSLTPESSSFNEIASSIVLNSINEDLLKSTVSKQINKKIKLQQKIEAPTTIKNSNKNEIENLQDDINIAERKAQPNIPPSRSANKETISMFSFKDAIKNKIKNLKEETDNDDFLVNHDILSTQRTSEETTSKLFPKKTSKDRHENTEDGKDTSMEGKKGKTLNRDTSRDSIRKTPQSKTRHSSPIRTLLNKEEQNHEQGKDEKLHIPVLEITSKNGTDNVTNLNELITGSGVISNRDENYENVIHKNKKEGAHAMPPTSAKTVVEIDESNTTTNSVRKEKNVAYINNQEAYMQICNVSPYHISAENFEFDISSSQSVDFKQEISNTGKTNKLLDESRQKDNFLPAASNNVRGENDLRDIKISSNLEQCKASAIFQKMPFITKQESDIHNDDINKAMPLRRNTFTIIGSGTSLQKSEEIEDEEMHENIIDVHFKTTDNSKSGSTAKTRGNLKEDAHKNSKNKILPNSVTPNIQQDLIRDLHSKNTGNKKLIHNDTNVTKNENEILDKSRKQSENIFIDDFDKILKPKQISDITTNQKRSSDIKDMSQTPSTDNSKDKNYNISYDSNLVYIDPISGKADRIENETSNTSNSTQNHASENKQNVNSEKYDKVENKTDSKDNQYRELYSPKYLTQRQIHDKTLTLSNEIQQKLENVQDEGLLLNTNKYKQAQNTRVPDLHIVMSDKTDLKDKKHPNIDSTNDSIQKLNQHQTVTSSKDNLPRIRLESTQELHKQVASNDNIVSSTEIYENRRSMVTINSIQLKKAIPDHDRDGYSGIPVKTYGKTEVKDQIDIELDSPKYKNYQATDLSLKMTQDCVQDLQAQMADSKLSSGQIYDKIEFSDTDKNKVTRNVQNLQAVDIEQIKDNTKVKDQVHNELDTIKYNSESTKDDSSKVRPEKVQNFYDLVKYNNENKSSDQTNENAAYLDSHSTEQTVNNKPEHVQDFHLTLAGNKHHITKQTDEIYKVMDNLKDSKSDNDDIFVMKTDRNLHSQAPHDSSNKEVISTVLDLQSTDPTQNFIQKYTEDLQSVITDQSHDKTAVNYHTVNEITKNGELTKDDMLQTKLKTIQAAHNNEHALSDQIYAKKALLDTQNTEPIQMFVPKYIQDFQSAMADKSNAKMEQNHNIHDNIDNLEYNTNSKDGLLRIKSENLQNTYVQSDYDKDYVSSDQVSDKRPLLDSQKFIPQSVPTNQNHNKSKAINPIYNEIDNLKHRDTNIDDLRQIKSVNVQSLNAEAAQNNDYASSEKLYDSQTLLDAKSTDPIQELIPKYVKDLQSTIVDDENNDLNYQIYNDKLDDTYYSDSDKDHLFRLTSESIQNMNVNTAGDLIYPSANQNYEETPFSNTENNETKFLPENIKNLQSVQTNKNIDKIDQYDLISNELLYNESAANDDRFISSPENYAERTFFDPHRNELHEGVEKFDFVDNEQIEMLQKLTDDIPGFKEKSESASTNNSPFSGYSGLMSEVLSDISENIVGEEVHSARINVVGGIKSRLETSQHHEKLDNEFINDKKAGLIKTTQYSNNIDTNSKVEEEDTNDVPRNSFVRSYTSTLEENNRNMHKEAIAETFGPKQFIAYSSDNLRQGSDALNIDSEDVILSKPIYVKNQNQTKTEYQSSKSYSTGQNEDSFPVTHNEPSTLSKQIERKSVEKRLHSHKFEGIESASLHKDPIYLDMSFYSYKNDNNQRIVQTHSPQNKRDPREGTVTVVKTLMRHENGIRIPVDEENDIALNILEKDFKISNKAGSIGSLLRHRHREKQVADLAKRHDEVINKNLALIYEKELIPLHNVIKDLAQEVNTLSAQQERLRMRIRNAKRIKSLRLIPVVKRCGCRRI